MTKISQNYQRKIALFWKNTNQLPIFRIVRLDACILMLLALAIGGIVMYVHAQNQIVAKQAKAIVVSAPKQPIHQAIAPALPANAGSAKTTPSLTAQTSESNPVYTPVTSPCVALVRTDTAALVGYENQITNNAEQQINQVPITDTEAGYTTATNVIITNENSQLQSAYQQYLSFIVIDHCTPLIPAPATVPFN